MQKITDLGQTFNPNSLSPARGLRRSIRSLSLLACIDVKIARTAGENAQPRRGRP